MSESVASAPVTTLTGPGGVGKTALAIAVAAACARDFPDGVTVVWLGSLRSAELVAAEVAAQLGLPRSGGQSYEDALTRWLTERDVLLVIDNCEHVASAVADLLDGLTARLPRLRVLTTSREPLWIDGEVTYRLAPLAVVTRKDLWITSKLWSNAHGQKNVAPALNKTLTDLGLDHVDLYMIHWPIPLKPTAVLPGSAADFMLPSEVPIHATWAGMEAAAAAGLTRHLGVSNFSVKKLRELLPHCKVRPEVNQVELHPLLQQPALVAYCASEGIHVTAYAPLGSGDRPAFLKAADAPVLLDNPVVRSIAEAHACTPAQVLLAWHVQRGISTIPKSITPARLRENLAAAQLELSATELERVAGLEQGCRLIAGAFWAVEGGPWTLRTIWDD